MDNDKIFAAYVITLVAAVGSAITASVLAGFATLPTAGVFLEHIALSVTFRAAYKSFGGFEWLTSTAQAIGFITVQEAENAASHGMSAANA